MPKLTAHYAQKLPTAEYANQQFSASIEVEIDNVDANAMLAGLRRLFSLAKQAVEEQFNGAGSASQTQQHTHHATATSALRPAQPQNSQTNGNGRHVPATPSQKKAIFAIAKSLRLDSAQFNVEALALKEASALIDDLKSRQAAR